MAYAHHLLIYFPVAFGLLGALCVVLGWWRRDDDLWTVARRRLSYLAALAALLAIATGLLSADHLIEGGVPEATVARHRNVALVAGGLFVLVAIAGWLGHRRDSPALGRLAELATLAAAAVVGGAAHFGGDMLHPGMAPWSDATHSHGVAAPHGHGAAEPEDDHGHEHAAGPAANDDAEPADARAATIADAGTDAADAVAPAQPHKHPPGTEHAPPRIAPTAPPRPAETANPAPTPAQPTPPAPSMSGMPAGHKM